jgi:para-nitrobenzyl esterase
VDLALGQALTDVALACPNHTAANALSAQVPTYAFEFADTQAPQFFDDPLSPKGWGAYHMGELLYVFGKPVSGLSYPGLNDAQKGLSAQMQSYWRQFVATGNPNGMSGNANDAAPTWPRYTKATTALQSLKPGTIVTQTHGEYQKAHQCGVWSSFYSLGAFFGMY